MARLCFPRIVLCRQAPGSVPRWRNLWMRQMTWPDPDPADSAPLPAILVLLREGGGRRRWSTILTRQNLSMSLNEEKGRTLRLDAESLLLLQGETDWMMHWGDKVGRWQKLRCFSTPSARRSLMALTEFTGIKGHSSNSSSNFILQQSHQSPAAATAAGNTCGPWAAGAAAGATNFVHLLL